MLPAYTTEEFFLSRLKLAVPTGAAPAVSTLTGWRVCCFSSGPEIGSPGRYCPFFRGLKDRCITLMLRRILD